MRPSGHKTVQARILQYAQGTGWTFVPRAEDEEPTVFLQALRKVAEVQERTEKS